MKKHEICLLFLYTINCDNVLSLLLLVPLSSRLLINLRGVL